LGLLDVLAIPVTASLYWGGLTATLTAMIVCRGLLALSVVGPVVPSRRTCGEIAVFGETTICAQFSMSF
jgi:hypothetical protein